MRLQAHSPRPPSGRYRSRSPLSGQGALRSTPSTSRPTSRSRPRRARSRPTWPTPTLPISPSSRRPRGCRSPSGCTGRWTSTLQVVYVPERQWPVSPTPPSPPLPTSHEDVPPSSGFQASTSIAPATTSRGSPTSRCRASRQEGEVDRAHSRCKELEVMQDAVRRAFDEPRGRVR